LLGEPELRELLDPDALAQVELELQHLDDRHKAKSIDGIHDLLLRVGDLSADDIAARCMECGGAAAAFEEQGKAAAVPPHSKAIGELLHARRVIEVSIA